MNTNIKDDGLGPCKEATQAEQGVIDIRFTEAAQTAIIAITADSQRHTRVKLICTEIEGATVFTVNPSQIYCFSAIRKEAAIY